MTVRSQFWSVRVPGALEPFDTIALKVHYPAGEPDRFTGIATADPAGSPYPVVVISPGINVGPESYRWLCEELVGAGFAAVTYTWVGELFPGQVGITPGADLAALSPDGWGSRPTSPALRPVLDGLRALAGTPGPLLGALDCDRVVLGGHSGGGSVALQNSVTRWFPEVVAGFSYGAHAGLATALGWPPESIVAPELDVPFLFLAGDRDGIIGGSAPRYGVEHWDPVARTVDEALPRGAAWVVLEGANHFAFVHPEDPTSARGFLDLAPSTPPEKSRALAAEAITLFCRSVVLHDAAATASWARWLETPAAGVARCGTVSG